MQIMIPTMNLRFVVREGFVELADLSRGSAGGVSSGKLIKRTILQQQWRDMDDPTSTEWRDVPTAEEK
jgi:hypothetical protein